MPERMPQCLGTTKAGQRCKILLKNGDFYCHFHIHQYSKGSFPTEPKTYPPNERYQRGFIYVYTLQHLLEPRPAKQDWLQLKRVNDDWVVFDPKKSIIVKIGLTQGSVQKRLRQWESQCSHKLSALDPYQDYQASSSITRLFSKLKLTDTDRVSFQTYDPQQQGFFTSRSLALIERRIHEMLWKKYGRGDVVCHGCRKEGKDQSIHKEWFLLKRRQLYDVFKLIDECILTEANA